MFLIRYGIVQSALEFNSYNLSKTLELQFPDVYFYIIVIINILLGAGGYVINDYFDRKIDSINKPQKVIIGNTIHRRFAIILHFTLNIIAVILAGYIAYQLQQPIVLLAYIALAGFYWFYSTTYKKQFLIGNIIVALITALIPMQIAYFDIIALNHNYGDIFILSGLPKTLFFWISAFAVFAFLTNFLREIIKDIEDFEGDRSYGCNTLPVVAGVKISKIVAIVISVSTIWLLAYLYFRFLNDSISKWYLLFAVITPLIIAIILTIKAKTTKQYHQLSWLIKIIMLTGILYAGLAKYIMFINF